MKTEMVIKFQSLKDSIVEACKSNAEAGISFESLTEALQMCMECWLEDPSDYGCENYKELEDILIQEYPYIIDYFETKLSLAPKSEEEKDIMYINIKFQSLKDAVIDACKFNRLSAFKFESLEEAVIQCMESYSETPNEYGCEDYAEIAEKLTEKYPYLLQYF
jgi:hypothetical protein